MIIKRKDLDDNFFLRICVIETCYKTDEVFLLERLMTLFNTDLVSDDEVIYSKEKS